MPETLQVASYPINGEIEQFLSFQDMDFWLQRFISEIGRKNGSPYPPQTLQNIAAGLQRYLREKSMRVNFFQANDETFCGFRKNA